MDGITVRELHELVAHGRSGEVAVGWQPDDETLDCRTGAWVIAHEGRMLCRDDAPAERVRCSSFEHVIAVLAHAGLEYVSRVEIAAYPGSPTLTAAARRLIGRA